MTAPPRPPRARRAGAAAAALGGCMSGGGELRARHGEAEAEGPAKQPARVYVDKDSIGGPCNDQPAGRGGRRRRRRRGAASTARWTPRRRASTILVRRGTYPRLTIQGERRTRFVTIRSAPGETATLNGFTATNSSYWRFQGLRFAGAEQPHLHGQRPHRHDRQRPHGVDPGPPEHRHPLHRQPRPRPAGPARQADRRRRHLGRDRRAGPDPQRPDPRQHVLAAAQRRDLHRRRPRHGRAQRRSTTSRARTTTGPTPTSSRAWARTS